MKLSLIFLSKVGLGGGGLGALIVSIIVLYCIYRKENPRDHNEPNGFQQLFGGLAFKLSESYDKKTLNTHYCKKFDLPPSMTLKLLVALTGVGLWFLGIFLMSDYDVSMFWVWLWGIFLPFFYVYLFCIWKHFFFIWLGKMRTPVAVMAAIISIILTIVFWILAIKTFNYFTSIEYLSEYWKRKYGVI